ncbi:testis-specific serine/threonine-protein kinase 1-like [Hyperolius riggenbachi]|uniref:testis-specific serine/threonine-protein kinase 1-like n=1 Tax=Hyperolius riggenbachi TaxID=752182 RepID=UPI0035A323A9
MPNEIITFLKDKLHLTNPHYQTTMDDATVLLQKGYKIGKHLGEGSYAKVKSAYSNRLKSNVAVKIIDRQKAPRDFVEKFLPRELEILTKVSHNSIIKTLEIFEKPNKKVYIIMELCVQGDLLEFIKSKGALSEETSRKLFRQIIIAVKYCHDKDIVHRDLKCENLLLDKDFNLKISDFGFARHVYHDVNGKVILSNTFCGSAVYASPEVLQGIPYNPKIHDVWSLGVILYIMVTCAMPYDDSNIKRMLRQQKAHKIDFSHSPELSSPCKEVICGMLEPDVTLRLTVDEILNHVWLRTALRSKEPSKSILKKEEVQSADHPPVSKQESQLDKTLQEVQASNTITEGEGDHAASKAESSV